MARERAGDGTRCTARSRRTDETCKAYAMPGLNVCRWHGGAAPQVQRRVQHAIIRQGIEKLLVPVPTDHPEADPLEAFSYEWRRTIAAIEYWTDKIRELADEEDLVWGKTKEVRQESTEFPGIDETYEAKINIYEASRREERKHLVELLKLYVKASIKAKAQQYTSDAIDALQAIVVNALLSVDADPNDPKVRDAVTKAIAAVS